MQIEAHYLGDWRSVGDRTFTTQEARAILGVRSRATWAKCLACLNWSGRRGFTRLDLIELFKLRLFLKLGNGNPTYSYDAYRRYRTQPALLMVAFKQLGVDLDREVQKFTRKPEVQAA